MERVSGAWAPTSASARGSEPVEFFTGDDIGPVLKEEFSLARVSVDIWAYILYHTELCNRMLIMLGQGASVRILMDQDNFFGSASARWMGAPTRTTGASS